MKTIKIFLASSEELKDERNTMADLILHLNKLFRGRGLELELEKWEYLDASMSGKRKQDEYNEVLKQCDICMVLFWRKFGSYTGEELDTAYKRMQQKEKPYKIYVFFKNPNSDEVTQELKDFIANYEQRFGGHFFCKYQNVDTMKLEFLLQLENYQKDLIGEKTIEVRNEHIYVDNEALVDLNNIPFAAQNEGFKKMQSDLVSLREKIELLRQKLEEKEAKLERKKAKLEKDPDDEDYQEDVKEAQEAVDEISEELQQYLDKKNKLEEDFDREQQNLFNTARRITGQRGLKITQRMVRAIEAFESGDAKRADIILDEAENDADQAIADVRVAKQVGLESLKELIFKISVKMSNNSIPIDTRIEDTLKIFNKADNLAQEINYNKEDYSEFLYNYTVFLRENAFYNQAINICERLILMVKQVYGNNKLETAVSINSLGLVYFELGYYPNALDNYKKALKVLDKLEEKNHLDASITNNIGLVYFSLGNFPKALEYHLNALNLLEKAGIEKKELMHTFYNNIGLDYTMLLNYSKALEYHFKALKNSEIINGVEHRDTAMSYNNIGTAYYFQGKYKEAMENHLKALHIQEKVLGIRHPNTAMSYCNIGSHYKQMNNISKALDYHFKALQIQENVLGENNPETAQTYNELGQDYQKIGDTKKAI